MKKITITILNTLLAVTIISTTIYASISYSISQNQIKESIKTNLLTGFIYDEAGDKTEIFKTIVKLTQLDEETVIRFMENETANQIITDIVNSIYDYNLTQDENYKYTKNQIIELVENNIDKILIEINYPITEKEKQEVINYTKNNTDYIIDTIYQVDIGGYKKW